MKSGNAFKHIGIVGIILLAAFAFYFASTFTSQSTENRSKAAVAKMYYFNTQNSTCTITPIGFASVDACKSALVSYGSATTGVCYTSLSACQTANGGGSTPIPTTAGGNGTASPTIAAGGSPLYYFNKLQSVCKSTSPKSFTSIAACQTFISGYGSTATTGVCFNTLAECQASASTPLPKTEKYYYNTQQSICKSTAPKTFSTVAECQTFISAYGSATTGQCFDTLSSCQGIPTTPTSTPITGGGTGSILYYFNTLNTTCSPTADKYSSVAACQDFLTQYASTYTSKICYSTIASCQEANGASFMYFYNTNTLACTQTAEKYVDSTKCDANLALYNPGITSSICYKTQQACQSAMFYFNETANACVGTRESYATVAACENVLNTTLAGKTGGICYTDYSLCKNAMYYYNKDSKMCLGTREKYATIDACQSALNTSLPGKTTGICYATLADCKAVLKRSDLNLDGVVDIFDYNILVENFDKTGANGFIRADIDKNGVVDIFDYNILVTDFGL